ncbi:MAG: hypothetical protein IKW08_05900 [Roseburia sp.]|nr:hypothetical protein [Roseburia sp.]
MLLDKKTYDECTVLVKEKSYEELERRLDKLNETLVISYVQDYLDHDDTRIKIDLKNSNRYKKLLAGMVSDQMSYRVGAFETIILIFELLFYKKNRKEDFVKRMKALNVKKNVNRIFMFLYANPDAQHKDISRSIGLKPNYLSELMRELEGAECVERYAIGKRSFYSLSKQAKEFIIEENNKKATELYKYKNNGYLKYETAENSQSNIIIMEKYDGIKPFKTSIMQM